MLKSTRPTPSTRRCPRNCVCSMAWRSTKVYLTRSLMSTQEVNNKSQWWHVRAGFPSIGKHKHAVAFSAALEREGLLDAPADDQRVAELYHETVGVHLEARREAKKVDGLELVVDEYSFRHLYTWTHGDIIVTTEDNARKFSAALKSRGLLEARAGDSRVQSTARKSKFHGRIFAEVRPSFLVSTGQESVRRGRHRATPRQQGAQRFDSH